MSNVYDLPPRPQAGGILDRAAAVQQLQAETAALCDYLELKATLTRRYYEALLTQGFAPEQALALCRDLS